MPRLKLSAALIAVKLAHTVRQETEYVTDHNVFWTDASVVLRYIQNTSSRYMSFVANRLELIHTLSTPQQWRYVPTNVNPADIGSGGVCCCCCLPDPFRGMGAWRKTMEPQKPGNYPGSGPEVVERQKVPEQ